MMGGATAVVTLLRPEDRDGVETEDQQFHVLPLYVPDCSEEDLYANVSKGGLVCLDKFQRTKDQCELVKLIPVHCVDQRRVSHAAYNSLDK